MFVLAAAAALLGGCGFQPVYGTWSPARQTADQVNRIEIANIPDRTGQQLRNELIDRFYLKGRPDRPAYRLEVSLSSSERKLGLTQNAVETRAQLELKARYKLIEIETGKVRYATTSRALVSYNLLPAQFATVAAEQNAYNRGVSELAGDIATRVALYFAREPGTETEVSEPPAEPGSVLDKANEEATKAVTEQDAP